MTTYNWSNLTPQREALAIHHLKTRYLALKYASGKQLAYAVNTKKFKHNDPDENLKLEKQSLDYENNSNLLESKAQELLSILKDIGVKI